VSKIKLQQQPQSNRSDLNKLSMKKNSLGDLLKSKAIKISGDQNALHRLFSSIFIPNLI
jgi:alkyl sulfatase BDS1-like metallo-beta-lactamase superfamily hydrolase